MNKINREDNSISSIYVCVYVYNKNNIFIVEK